MTVDGGVCQHVDDKYGRRSCYNIELAALNHLKEDPVLTERDVEDENYKHYIANKDGETDLLFLLSLLFDHFLLP